MDDGSLQGPIDEHAAAAEEELEHTVSPESRFQNDEVHLAPSRWWFASSAFPMIAGTLGPVASAFSICALATFLPDPVWLTTVNAVQLAMAVVSNMFLLLNMTKRVRFSIAQPITIVGWYISAICLMALNATAAGPLDDDLNGVPASEIIWSQAFYYGIWAAILYFVDASLMLVTFLGACSGRYSKDFNLTPSQRTLMLQTIMFLMYLLLGALIFSTIEGWNYLDGVYFADVTLFTVGFGDFTASTTLARALLFPYALIGVISLGLVISSIRSMILERGRRALDARMEEKNRRRVIRTITKKGKDDVLTPLEREPTLDEPPAGELERRRTEFELMRKIQEKASLRRKWVAMGISTGTWLVLWLLGAFIFMKCEGKYQGWTYFDGVYFCFVSLITIGYGDVTPQSNAGKSFFVFWSLMALPTMTVLISNAGDTVVVFVRDATITLGNITILPGDEGFVGNIKYVANQLTFGAAFKSVDGIARDVEKQHHGSSEGFKLKDRLSNTNSNPNDRATTTTSVSQDDSPPGTSDSPSTTNLQPMSTRGRRSLSVVRNRLDNLPEGQDLHLLLISEIQNVAKHVREAKPRRYTFEEWAWYLGLIGEDERDPDTHRKARPKQKHKHRKKKGVHTHHPHDHHHRRRHQNRGRSREGEDETYAQATEDRRPEDAVDDLGEESDVHESPGAHDEDRLKWSWVGRRSPLMGGQEESEWILERLMDRLKESLWKTKKAAESSDSESKC
ncbi:potassium channel [Purpureocillium lavendulum]|uniref:Potassium channel n=1 Tax=Purpureocillium lavendulum TaxID=1247861 RepID=A0AB34FIP1_9HYPO|nr:potassium channel [Purpureocillium lavendulum]